MIAETARNDFTGTAAATITDSASNFQMHELAEFFNLDLEKYEVVGLSLYGSRSDDIGLAFICIDKEKSNEESEHIVKVWIEGKNEDDILGLLFKAFEIVLYPSTDRKYRDLDFHEEVTWNPNEETNEG